MNDSLLKLRIDTSPHFDLTNPTDRQDYFQLKAGPEIKALRKFLASHTFVAFLLSKKMAGKGTYTKMLMEALGSEHLAHISVGDVVRRVHEEFESGGTQRRKLIEAIAKHYRGYISLTQAFDALLGRDTKSVSVPTELILALLKEEISHHQGKGIFIDGFPRTLDQVSYSLYLRDLINYRDDPDFFVLIELPQNLIDLRIKERRVCPVCQTSRNLLLNPTSTVQYNSKLKEYQLCCDNPSCNKAVMVRKEGDEFGVAHLQERMDGDQELLNLATSLQGMQHIRLLNSVAVDQAKEYFNDYEITPQFSYTHNATGKVTVHRKPLIVKDDDGADCHPLMAAPVVVHFIKHLATLFKLS